MDPFTGLVARSALFFGGLGRHVASDSGHRVIHVRASNGGRMLRTSVRANQPLQHFWLRCDGAKKAGFVADCQQDRRKVLNVQRVQQIGLIFHVDPQKLSIWKAGLHLLKTGAVIPAHPAPIGAQAGNEHRVWIGWAVKIHGAGLEKIKA